MKNEKLAEFLQNHKYNCENFNEEGNYDPNPYWLADDIVEFLNLQNVSNNKVPICLMLKDWFKSSDDGDGGKILMAECPNCGDAVVYDDSCVKCDAIFEFK